MPKDTVKPNREIEDRLSDERRQECDQVSSKPENNRMKVFSRGIYQHGIGEMPTGGQSEPSSTEGESEECR